MKSRTDGIKEKDRPDVYYAGVDILTTYGKHSDIIDLLLVAVLPEYQNKGVNAMLFAASSVKG